MINRMNMVTTGAIFFLAAGIFSSVTVLSAYQILFTVVCLYFFYKAYSLKQLALPTSAYWLLAFAGLAFISLIINFDLVPNPSKNFGRVKYFLYGSIGIYVFRFWIKDLSHKTKRILANTFFLSIVVAASYAIWNSFTVPGQVRSFTEPMRYSYGTGMALLVLITAVLHRENLKEWFNWRFALVAIIFSVIGLYLVNTRGPILGLLCGLPFVFYFYRPKYGIIIGIIAGMIVLFLGGYYLFGKNSTQTATSSLIANKDNASDVTRRSQWKAAIIATKEKPILGWGLSNFHTQVKRIKAENNLDAQDYVDAHAHNLFLEICAGTGILGFMVFLGWLITWAIESFRSTPLIRALVVPMGVAFVVSSQFEVTFDLNNASMIFFVYALSSAFNPAEERIL